jgi:hypothetical protein
LGKPAAQDKLGVALLPTVSIHVGGVEKVDAEF